MTHVHVVSLGVPVCTQSPGYEIAQNDEKKLNPDYASREII